MNYPIQWQKQSLWSGCMLASIAHAIMVAHYPLFAHEHSWDGFNYNVQDSAGARGTITFHEGDCVAAFRNERSTVDREAIRFFDDAPQVVIELATNETLQYLLDERDGKVAPVITAAFWGGDAGLYSCTPFDVMYQNGGFLLETQAMDVQSAIEAWVEYHEMSEQQCELLQLIYDRKMASPCERIVLSREEVAMIGSEDPEGMRESRVSFKEIGIEWDC